MQQKEYATQGIQANTQQNNTQQGIISSHSKCVRNYTQQNNTQQNEYQ